MNDIAKYTAIKENTAVADNPVVNVSCAACGSPNVTGRYCSGIWRITCPDCGVFMERPDVSEKTELENEVDILNSYEKLRYQVDKSKEV